MLDSERDQVEACLQKADQIISQYNAMVLGHATQWLNNFLKEINYNTKNLTVLRTHDSSEIVIRDGDKVVSTFIMKEPEDITRIKLMSAQIKVALARRSSEP